MLSEQVILNRVVNGEVSFPPLSLKLLGTEIRSGDSICDALFGASWEGVQMKFAAEIRRYSSERAVMEAARQSRYAADQFGALPLIITPWLSPEQLEKLEREGISGIDLSGNGIVFVPGKILIVRSGKPNLYPDSRVVKNVYEGSSSLVARTFLLKSMYGSVNELLEEIQSRGGSITQSTVSKALKQLEEDLVVWREKGLIKVLQATRLLDRLADNFKLLRNLEQVSGKANVDLAKVPELLSSLAEKAGSQIIITGASSVNRYATMGKEPVFTFYCNGDIGKVLSIADVEIEQSSRFPNFRIMRTDDQTVFFDPREENGVRWASPIQTYLELMKGDSREKQTAEQVRKAVLSKIDSQDVRK